jgi:hypothetical protein
MGGWALLHEIAHVECGPVRSAEKDRKAGRHESISGRPEEGA